MRETLHQLSLALALPLAVTAVWIVRGDPAGVPATQTATAYRVELADLPLPTPRRLRAPHEVDDRLGVHRQPEDPIARRRRAALPNLAAPQPIEFAVEAGSRPDWGVAPSPRDGQPQRTGAPALALPDAFPMLPTPIIVASRTAGVRARTGAAESDAGAAVGAPEPDPVAEVAESVSTTSENTRVAPVDRDSVRAPDGAPIVKIVRETGVPTRVPVKPSAEPEPVIAPVRSAALELREKSSGPISVSPFSPNHASPSPSVPSSSKGKDSVLNGEPASDRHETWKPGAVPSSSGRGRWKEFAGRYAPRATPYPTHAASERPDLSLDPLDRDEWKNSLLHTLLPATSVTPKPAPWQAVADPIAASPDSLVAMTLQTFSDLAWALAEDFAVSSDAEDGASSPAPFSNSSWLFSPIFTLHAIPEPASALLLGAALAGLAALRRRGRRG